jgi:type IV secretory pathway VirD2 relaxase
MRITQLARFPLDPSFSAFQSGFSVEFITRSSAVINNLREQEEGSRSTAQKLAEQTQKGQEAAQALARKSVRIYVDFMNSMFFGSRNTVGVAGRVSSKTDSDLEAETPKDQTVENLPLEEYDSLSVNAIRKHLDELSIEEIERLRDYEVGNKNRRTLMARFDRRIEAESS